MQEAKSFIVFGKTGVGKSATCNTLIGTPKFVSKRQGKWVTENSQTCAFEYENESYVCVDTPGLFDSRYQDLDFSEQSQLFVDLVSEFHKALKMCPNNGTNALVICIPGTERCDMLTVALVIALERIFGESISTNAILCVTRADDFDTKDEFDNWVKECKDYVPAFRSLLAKCGGRIFPISNKCTISWIGTSGKEKLLEMIALLPLYSTDTFEASRNNLLTRVANAALKTKSDMKSGSLGGSSSGGSSGSSSGGGGGGGCIASHQYVSVYRNGENLYIPLFSLDSKDLVCTTKGFKNYIGDLHKPHFALTLRFILKNGLSIEVTPEHLLKGKNGFVAAQTLKVGDELLVLSDKLPYSQIVEITSQNAHVAAPLTSEGNIIVNECVVSCFAYVPQWFAEMVYFPLFLNLQDDPEKYTTTLIRFSSHLPKALRNFLPKGVDNAVILFDSKKLS